MESQKVTRGKIVYVVTPGYPVIIKIHSSFRMSTSPKPETVGDLYSRYLSLSWAGPDSDISKIDALGLHVASSVATTPGVTNVLISQYELSLAHSPAVESENILAVICPLLHDKFALYELMVYHERRPDLNLSVHGKDLLPPEKETEIKS